MQRWLCARTRAPTAIGILGRKQCLGRLNDGEAELREIFRPIHTAAATLHLDRACFVQYTQLTQSLFFLCFVHLCLSVPQNLSFSNGLVSVVVFAAHSIGWSSRFILFTGSMRPALDPHRPWRTWDALELTRNFSASPTAPCSCVTKGPSL